MNIALMSLIIGFLYGTYDLFLKLSTGKIQANLGAVLCQTFSALFALGIFLFFKQTGKITQVNFSLAGIFAIIAAAICIGLALILILTVLAKPEAKASTIVPTVLIIRNVTVVLWGILLLRENFNLIKLSGIFLSLFGVYLISI